MPPWLPAVVPERAAGFGEVDPALAAYVDELRGLAAAGDRAALAARLPESLELAAWLDALPPDHTLAIELVASVRLAGVVYGKLVVTAEGRAAPPHMTIDLELRDGEARPVLLDPTTTERFVGAVRAVTGEVAIDPVTRWIHGDLALALAAPPAARFVVFLPAPELRVAVEVAGRAQPSYAYNDLVVIEPGGTNYRVRFEGRLDDTVVFDFGAIRYLRLVPLVGLAAGTPAAIDVALHHPADTGVFASLPTTAAPRGPSWQSARLAGTTDELALWMTHGADPHDRAEVALGSTRVELTAPARRLAVDRAALEAAWASLAPLGPLPVDALRVHVMPGLVRADHVAGAIGLGIANDDARVFLVAHELAHAWFGGAVPGAGTSATRWWEAVANYVALWALTDEDAEAWRREWLANLDALPRAHERADRAHAVVGAAADVLSYDRGALILCGLEARVGRPAMVRWLRALIETRRGRPTDLDAMLATVGPALGAAHEVWARAWFTAGRPATVALVDARLAGGRLRGMLVVDAPVPALQLIARFAASGGGRGAPVAIAITGPRTPIALQVPPMADVLDLGFDPWAPLRHADPEWPYGLQFELPGVLPAGEDAR